MKAELLHGVCLLQGLEPAELERVAGYMHLRFLERGQWALRKGGGGEQLLFLLEGLLQVIDTNDVGQAVGLHVVRAGDFFGELSVIDGLPRSASVLALEASQVASLPREQALMLFCNHPLVAERLLKRMAAAVRQATRLRSILALPQAPQRICALLDHLSHLAPGNLAVIEPLPRQREVARMVNTSRETVSRVLQLLLRQQVVQKDRQRLIVRNPQALREASRASPPESP